ncbi:MAG: hypothetical protein ACE5EO_04820 [Candidatus Krumholzibacteriia bacterium]
MNSRLLAVGLALVLVSLCFLSSHAQVPTYSIVLSNKPHCPGVGVADTLTILLVDAGAPICGAAFQVTYPPSMLWIADFDTAPATVGTTPSTVSMAWPTPLDGLSPIVCARVAFQWTCSDCAGHENEQVLMPAALIGFCTGNVPGNVSPGEVCPTISPVEQSTWGRLKALYEQ